ncbi:MAG: hypothetical protein LBT09_03445 [Planctomycetaceae bacterium]|jgi:hypothetical protein|nr:hypothetical protein [Planctomycetaceae bacterium]
MKHIKQICLCNIALIAIVLSMIGCSQNVPLSGRITFADNDEPLSAGTIAFVSGTSQARSEIGKDGKYQLGFEREGSGLPKGEYKVYIQALHVKIQTGKDDNGDGEPDIIGRTETPLIAKKYATPETSGLVFIADGKTKTFDIKVERAGSE